MGIVAGLELSRPNNISAITDMPYKKLRDSIFFGAGSSLLDLVNNC